jgi:hypothetical protein
VCAKERSKILSHLTQYKNILIVIVSLIDAQISQPHKKKEGEEEEKKKTSQKIALGIVQGNIIKDK